ncbi:alginate O-acetyltransferase AlgF [Sinorhizobium sp. BJ1]|uniref:alginate O-acetyltransferase AlgF n=1 Tax=Sinorhizobium sp. BJ1 TaxID=2035455 RepID=UPI000BE9690C|nr:alginate O-acetyltransferase AlgF [Sinorhizobium sp. BJ1]PDT80351.1 hypothetical protein CO676_28125 [Sinorhizobium sp. BJ1]
MNPKSQAVLAALALTIVTAIAPKPTLAGDAALYDAPIPADKSLVRFLNVKLKSGVILDFSGQKLDVDAIVLSNYRALANGSYKISDGASSAEAKLEAGKLYTIAVGAADGIVVIQDKDVENPSKSALSFYNFSAQPANLLLRLDGDSKALFKDLAPAGMASKELPVIDIGLEVTEGDKKVMDVEKVSLTAKERQNIVVVETANGPTAFAAVTGIDN